MVTVSVAAMAVQFTCVRRRWLSAIGARNSMEQKVWIVGADIVPGLATWY
jgi:hypothetical protein